jgi:hypothetical protein
MKASKQASKALATLDSSSSAREVKLADANMTMLHAAERAVRLDVDLNTFMQGAYAAYMQANPAAREHFEAMQLLAHVEDLRRRGVLAAA